MNPSRKSRSELEVGTVIHYRDFEGKTGQKDRYFIVVAIDENSFYCFTTTTQTYLLESDRFKAEASPIIQAGSTCLPKKCVVDYRNLHRFDDIVMTNRLTTNRARVIGHLPDSILIMIKDGVKNSKLLPADSIRRVVVSLSPKFFLQNSNF